MSSPIFPTVTLFLLQILQTPPLAHSPNYTIFIRRSRHHPAPAAIASSKGADGWVLRPIGVNPIHDSAKQIQNLNMIGDEKRKRKKDT